MNMKRILLHILFCLPFFVKAQKTMIFKAQIDSSIENGMATALKVQQDSNGHRAVIASKLNSSDTSTMLANYGSAISLKANIANPTFTGTVKIGTDTAATKQDVRTGGSAITYPNTALKYINGYGGFVTLNTDSITNGISKLLGINQGTMPTAQTGVFWNNTGFPTVPNSNGIWVYQRGQYYSDGTRWIPLTMEGNAPISVGVQGDSWAAGYNLAGTANRWANKSSELRGWNLTNNAASGTSINSTSNSFIGTNSDYNLMEVGINDLKANGYAGMEGYINMMRNWAVFRTAGTVINGTVGTKTTPSDWIADSILFNFNTATRTTVDNSPITFTIAGGSVYVAVAHMAASNVTYNVAIDGVDKGTYTATESGYTNISGTNPNNNATFYCRRFTGLGDSVHTVVLKKTGGTGQFRVIYVASNNQPRLPFAASTVRAYALSIGKLVKGVAGASGYAFYGGSDTLVDRYNKNLEAAYFQLAKDGLNAQYIDVNKYWSPHLSGYMQSDSLHPTDLGNTAIGKAVVEATSVSMLPSDRQRIRYISNYVASDDAGNGVLGGLDGARFRLINVTKALRDLLPNIKSGDMIFQTDNIPGLRVFNGTNWIRYTETVD